MAIGEIIPGDVIIQRSFPPRTEAFGNPKEDVVGPESLVLLVILIVAVIVMSRINLSPKVKCTRCDGTGQVNEKWPDPSEPGGWHRVDGTCPKCKGKGKV
jgi:hypothetical protein